MCPSQVTDQPVLEHTVPVHSTYPPPIQQFTRTVQEYGDSDEASASMSDKNTPDEIVFLDVLRIAAVINPERMTANTAEMTNLFFIKLSV